MPRKKRNRLMQQIQSPEKSRDFCYPPTVSKSAYCLCPRVGAVVDLVADAVDGLRVFGFRSCSACGVLLVCGLSVSRSDAEPLTARRCRAPFGALKRLAAKRSNFAVVRLLPFHPAESTAEPRKSREGAKK